MRIITTLRIAFLISLHLTIVCMCYGQSEQRIEIQEIQGDHLLFRTYQFKDVQRVDLSDLIVAQEFIGKADPRNRVYISLPDFKEELLRAGMAELRNPETASEKYKSAQEAAKRQRAGLWYKRLAQPINTPSPHPSISATATPASQTPQPTLTPITKQNQPEETDSGAWKIITILSTLGITGVIAAGVVTLIRRFWIRRPVRLLIFEELSAGKTAISERLLDPNVARSKLEGLRPSQSIVRTKKRIGIPRGEYVIFPQITDIPGSFYGSVWDELTKLRLTTQRIWLFVVAPTPMNKQSGNQAHIDNEYVSVQLGIVKTQVLGGLDARKTIKPKAVILFINKFDLFSPVKPGDSAAAQAEQDFNRIFSKHIDVIRNATARKGVHFYPIVGSAYNSWNCDYVLDRIGAALYGS